jgi:hypothetical protein
MQRSPNASRVARWLGQEQAEELARHTAGYYGRPLPIVGTPWASYRGDYVRNRLREFYVWNKVQLSSQIGGFASWSDLLAEYTAGKGQVCAVQKTGVTGVGAVCNTLWFEGTRPPAGAAGAALSSGGTQCNRATTGALGQADPGGGDTLHVLKTELASSQSGQQLLMVDRLWHGAPAMNSSAAQPITMSLPRYASGPDAVGNICFMEVGATALAATAHNNTITYCDQDGNAAEAAPACAGVSAAIAKRFDHAAYQWFMPLNGSDTGITQLTQYQCSAAVATGVMNLVVAHPVCFFPFPIGNYMVVMDGVSGAFQFARVLAGACLSFVEFMKPSTTAANYAGIITLVAG